jgi:hypothetical protein
MPTLLTYEAVGDVNYEMKDEELSFAKYSELYSKS